ncbi:MAG: type II toxin-antitoxin system RelE/ParE family toxin [Deferribacteraceae bacterium]|jgi:plasmid stabilization system protein ParE|nr:type II toxin-antitoxin system RelE/ParE family toxin [Deferribacteraceae bacterium]
MDHLAAKTELRIEGAVDKLLTFPNIGRIGRIEGTRELIMPDMPFVIVYQISENIEILNVWHTSRMPYLK